MAELTPELQKRIDEEINAPIPWQCWEIPSFKPCHAEAWAKTNRFLKDNGIVESNPRWKELFDKNLPRFVYDCQTNSGCSRTHLKSLPPVLTERKKKSLALLAGLIFVTVGTASYFIHKRKR